MVLVGQAIYTWSNKNLFGQSGFGFVAVSPGVESRLQWLAQETRQLTLFEPLAGHPVVDPKLQEAILPFREVIDGIAITGYKTFQGEDGKGRPGRYCIQMLLSDAFSLPVSCVASLNPQLLVRPRSLDVDSELELRDLDSDELVPVAASYGDGARVGALIARLRESDWRYLDISADELPYLGGLMGLLSEIWDVHSSIAVHQVYPEPLWRLVIRAETDRSDDRYPDGISSSRPFIAQAGDEEWMILRDRLGAAKTRRDLAVAWDMGSVGSVQGKPRTVDGNRVASAIEAFANGRGAELCDMLNSQSGVRNSQLREVVLEFLANNNRRMVARDSDTTGVSASLLAAYEGAWGKRNRNLSRIIPDSAVELATLAQAALTPSLLEEIAKLNQSADKTKHVTLSDPSVQPELWRVINQLWSREDTATGIIATLRLSGVTNTSLIGKLLELPRQTIPYDWLFEEVIPATFTVSHGLKLVAENFDEFKDYANLNQYYWRMFRFDKHAMRFWRRLRR
nr:MULTISPECIES: hypothetical protein [Nocardia]